MLSRIFLLRIVSTFALPLVLLLAPTFTQGAVAYAAEYVTIPKAPLSPAPEGSPIPVGTGPLNAEEREQLLQRSKQLASQASEQKAAADARYAAAQTDCWKKTLVSACLDDAKLALRKEMELVRQYERESRTIERDVKKHDAAENAVKRDAENARRDAEMEAKAAQYRADREAEEAARAAKRK